MRALSMLAVCIAGAVGAIACHATASRPEVAAVLVDPTVQTRTELLSAVRKMLGVSSVVLADDAFTRSNVLIIERQPARDQDRVRISGRDMDRPITFKLVKIANDCVLLDTRDEKRVVLPTAVCREYSLPR
jgi:hypothetical protein